LKLGKKLNSWLEGGGWAPFKAPFYKEDP
jgi:hypothetical protein